MVPLSCLQRYLSLVIFCANLVSFFLDLIFFFPLTVILDHLENKRIQLVGDPPLRINGAMIDPNFVVERSQFYRLRINAGDGMEVNMAFDGGGHFDGKKRKKKLWAVYK